MTNTEYIYVKVLGDRIDHLYEQLGNHKYEKRFSFIEMSNSKGSRPCLVIIGISNKKPWPFKRYESVFIDGWLSGVDEHMKEMIVKELQAEEAFLTEEVKKMMEYNRGEEDKRHEKMKRDREHICKRYH